MSADAGDTPVTLRFNLVAASASNTRARVRRIFATFAQRWDADFNHSNAIIEVLTKATFGNSACQVAIGRGKYAHVNGSVLVVPDTPDLALLQHPEELDLHARGYLPQFVHEQGPMVRGLEQAWAIVGRPRESAPRVSEQLTLQQSFANGAAVDG